jgi:hypothetical protein
MCRKSNRSFFVCEVDRSGPPSTPLPRSPRARTVARLNFSVHISDYVYNPKEARIRKAMRDATRERSIGTSPMLPRPNARRASSHGWVPSPHDDLMMVRSLPLFPERALVRFRRTLNTSIAGVGPIRSLSSPHK